MKKARGFARDERLTRKAEFDRVCKQGRAFRTPEVTLLALPNAVGRSRLGLIVRKPAGGAPMRNKMKRLVREAFRLNKALLASGYDIVAITRPEWRDLRLAVVEAHFRELFRALSNCSRQG